MKRPTKLLLGLTALALLAGCGIKTGLDRPDPMWGADSARAREAEQQARDDAAQAERNARRSGTPAGTPPLTSQDPVLTSPSTPTTP